MSSIKSTKEETIAIINSALTILNRFPNFDTTNTSLSINTSLNPFEFLMDLFKSTAGYNVFIKMISKFIALYIDSLEIAVKGILLSNIKNLLSCSINPYITDELLSEGIIFDLRRLDIMGVLSYSPLSPIGKNYYFGCNDFKCNDQLKDAGDFDAFLWYVKNKAVKREVWYGVNLLDANLSMEEYLNMGDDIPRTIRQKKPKTDAPECGLVKCKKSHGILTLKYSTSPNNLKNAEGRNLWTDGVNEDISYYQTPHGDCLQVFIGNTQEQENGNVHTISTLEQRIKECEDTIIEKTDAIAIKEDQLSDILSQMDFLKKQYKDQVITKEYYESEYDRLDDLKVNKKAEIATLVGERKTQTNLKKTRLGELRLALRDRTLFCYRGIRQNYYYKRTLIEFNTDYVMSLKLFDPKTVTAKLFDALTGCLTVDLNMSYEQFLVKYEVERMVKSIVETDDTVVSDCFFAFTNEEYDKQLRKAELARERIYSSDNGNPTGVKVDTDKILSMLNTINDGSSKESIQTVIEGGLIELGKTISDVSYEYDEKFNAGAQMNFIENIMQELAYVLTVSVLSPKVYLLLTINLKLLGRQTDFSIEAFIEAYRRIIVEMIRSIRDAIVQYLVDELMKILEGLAKDIALRYAIEQAEYYTRLIRKLIDCFKNNRGGLPFDIGNIDYADIIQEEQTPQDNNC